MQAISPDPVELWLPSYFRDAMGVSFANAGVYAAAPWLAAFATGNVVAVLADKAIARGAAVVFVRKLIIGVGLLSFAGFLLLVREAHSATSALVLVCAATGALGICWSGFAPNLPDIAPRHCAVLMTACRTHLAASRYISVDRGPDPYTGHGQK